MPTLDPTLRSALGKAVVEARGKAEDGARAALDVLAVNNPRAFATLTEEQRALRNALRAKGPQLGSGSQSTGFTLLVEEVAYVQWHRMLFARFLAENNLLMHPTGVAVTLEDCQELAAAEGDLDRWATAARYAGTMLPGIFAPDDPSIEVKFAPESRAALEAVLSAIPGRFSHRTMALAGCTSSGSPKGRRRSAVAAGRLKSSTWRPIRSFLPRTTWCGSCWRIRLARGGPHGILTVRW